MPTIPHDNRSTPAKFRSKLGAYLTGVAIGFALLGTVYYFKARAVEREQARQQESSKTQQETGVEQTGARP